MCGINGILSLQDHKSPITEDDVIKIRDAMKTRGPDDAGIWVSEDGAIGLGHRRLSIIDLSELGHQPMSWANQRYWITYNGEIYNYQQLRTELVNQGTIFVSQTDTEVILALYEKYGSECLSHIRGMYAFAIWDSYEKVLFLARDPYGIKPLYYSSNNGYFEFASQVKALEHSNNISHEASPAGVVGFLLWGSVPEPHTIRRDVLMLPAGHFLFVKQCQVYAPRSFYIAGNISTPLYDNISLALQDTVKAHMIADVPVGVFLSSGLDSIMLAALAQQIINTPVSTLTVTFERFKGSANDEAPLAAEIANLLGTQHTEITISSAEFSNLWDEIILTMDQPTIDGFNSYIISKIARQCGLKVVLSGVGGDELFGGYKTFRQQRSLAMFSKVLHAIPKGIPLSEQLFRKIVGNRNPKITRALRYGNSIANRYLLKRGLFLQEELSSLVGEEFAREGLKHYSPTESLQDMISNTNWDLEYDHWIYSHIWESGQYMRNQLLRDSDWASMAHSIELRTPIVDNWLRESVSALNFQPAKNYGKAYVARNVAPHLPDKVFERPKTGFNIPAAEWVNEGKSLHRGAVSRELSLKILREFNISI